MEIRIKMKDNSIVKRYTFWDWLAWIAFAYAVVYFTLKALGVLYSPVPLDLLGIASVAYYLGKYAQKIDRLVDDVEDLKYILNEHIMDRKLHR